MRPSIWREVIGYLLIFCSIAFAAGFLSAYLLSHTRAIPAFATVAVVISGLGAVASVVVTVHTFRSKAKAR